MANLIGNYWSPAVISNSAALFEIVSLNLNFALPNSSKACYFCELILISVLICLQVSAQVNHGCLLLQTTLP